MLREVSKLKSREMRSTNTSKEKKMILIYRLLVSEKPKTEIFHLMLQNQSKYVFGFRSKDTNFSG